MTPKLNPPPQNNPPNPVPNVPSDNDLDTSSSDYSLLGSYNLSDFRYPRRGQHTINKNRSKNSFNESIKKCENLVARIIKDEYN